MEIGVPTLAIRVPTLEEETEEEEEEVGMDSAAAVAAAELLVLVWTRVCGEVHHC